MMSSRKTGRRYSIIKNDAGKRLYSPNLPESLRGLENRPGCIPCFGYDPEERPLPYVLLRYEATQLLRRLIFYGWGEEAVTGLFIVWGREAGSKGGVGGRLAAV